MTRILRIALLGLVLALACAACAGQQIQVEPKGQIAVGASVGG